MTTAVQNPNMSLEQIAESMRESMNITGNSDDESEGNAAAGRRSSSTRRIGQGPPMEIVIVTPPESPNNNTKAAPPPPPPPPAPSSSSTPTTTKRITRRMMRGGGTVKGEKVEVVRPSDANKVLGFTDRSKTAVAKLFTKIPVVSGQGAAGILAKRIRNAKAKEEQQRQAAAAAAADDNKPVSGNASAKSGRSGKSAMSGVLSKAASFISHSIAPNKDERKKTKNHVKPIDGKTAPAATPIPKAPPVIIPAISPQQLLDRIHLARGYSVQNFISLQGGYHSKPTELQQASYGTKLVEAVRSCDSALLRRLLQAGLSPNPCNAYGESLLHMVCRRGDLSLLHEMMNAGCSLQVTDDFGRTPLHDACWTTSPNFGLITEILTCDIRLFRILDCRGASPLSYIKKDNWVQWIQYFHSTINRFWPPRDKALKGEEPPPPLVLMPPNSRPIPDPPNALPIDVATLVANGKRDPDVAKQEAFLQQVAREQALAREQSLRQQMAKEQSARKAAALQHVPEPVEVSKPDEYPEAESDDDSDSISTDTSASSTYSSSSCSSDDDSDDDDE